MGMLCKQVVVWHRIFYVWDKDGLHDVSMKKESLSAPRSETKQKMRQSCRCRFQEVPVLLDTSCEGERM